jgi:hypothetical protein
MARLNLYRPLLQSLFRVPGAGKPRLDSGIDFSLTVDLIDAKRVKARRHIPGRSNFPSLGFTNRRRPDQLVVEIDVDVPIRRSTSGHNQSPGLIIIDRFKRQRRRQLPGLAGDLWRRANICGLPRLLDNAGRTCPIARHQHRQRT